MAGSASKRGERDLARYGRRVSATLVVVMSAVYGCADIATSELVQPDGVGAAVDAARHDPNVFFFEDFESEDYAGRFTQATHARNRRLVGGDVAFNGLQSLRVTINEADHNGASLRFQFAEAGMSEPSELYARYYLRFGDDWDASAGGGKLPGPAGTYGRAGWGGRRSDGVNGWSARMAFLPSWFGPDLTDIAYYVYHADMRGTYGDHLLWDIGYRGSLEKNRWYCIETYVRMNTPGESDGVLRGWVDGHLALEAEDIRFRTSPDLKIEEFWANIYYGGSVPSPREMHVFLDNFALSTQRIGTVTGQVR